MRELERFRIGEKYFTNSWRHPNKLFVIEVIGLADSDWVTFKRWDGTIVKQRVESHCTNKYHSYESLSIYEKDKGFLLYYSFNTIKELESKNRITKNIQILEKILNKNKKRKKYRKHKKIKSIEKLLTL